MHSDVRNARAERPAFPAEGNSRPLRLVVSGASGVLGQALVPQLREGGAQLVALGRDPARLRLQFPDIECLGYDEWVDACGRADAIVHLAVLNNDSSASMDEFRRINVGFAERLAREAVSAGVGTFINISSVLALQHWDNSPYAVSKREAAAKLKSIDGLNLFNLYLPYVVSRRQLPRKLRWLNRLPEWLGKGLLSLVAAMKPTVDPDAVASFLLARGWQLRDEMVLSTGQSDNIAYKTAARLTDIAFAIGILGGFWWLLIAIAAAIRIDSRGSPIFAQTRVGKKGIPFTCYKFRTMAVGTPHVATHEVTASAVTRLGSFLRRTKLDELPQAWNLLRGQISLIGPRPCLPAQIRLVETRRSLGVLEAKPGISGLAQIDGVDMSDPEWLATYDARYLGIQSLAVDWRIIFETARGRGNEDRVRHVAA